MSELKNIITIHVDVDKAKDFIIDLVKENPKISKALTELIGMIILNSKKEEDKGVS